MWISLCSIFALLIGASYQRAADTVSLPVLNDNVSHWKYISSTNDNTISPGFTTDDPKINCSSSTCGVLGKRLGIVGGNFVNWEYYAFVVQIFYNDDFICGGSLINKIYVLTAAHCIFDEPSWSFNRPEEIFVKQLVYNFSANNFVEIDVNVIDIIPHENFNREHLINDIALLRLADTFDCSEYEFRTVRLPYAGETFVDFNGAFVGWGSTFIGGDPSNVLQAVRIPIISNEKCRSQLYPIIITDNMMCAGFDEGGKSPCTADGGGPLVIIRNLSVYIVGIFSSVDPDCGAPNNPSVFTRVNNYLDWLYPKIMENIVQTNEQ